MTSEGAGRFDSPQLHFFRKEPLTRDYANDRQGGNFPRNDCNSLTRGNANKSDGGMRG
jgi:hypothetical protein